MANSVLIDNDILLKVVCYQLVDEVLGIFTGKNSTFQILGAAPFVLKNSIQRKKNICDTEGAKHRLSHLLSKVNLIEPSDEELMLAAEIEQTAQSLDLELDCGESQLLAFLIKRDAVMLLTGDKRAIRAIKSVLQTSRYRQNVQRRIACLEQVVITVIGQHDAADIRLRVCAEKNVDKSLSVCFSCASENYNEQSIRDGLASYIQDLRRQVEWALVTSDNLSAMVS